MVWGRVTVGGIELRETVGARDDPGGLQIGGQESHPPSTRAHVESVHHNLVAMRDLVVPVVFTDKAGLTGFYRVSDTRSNLTRWQGGAVQTADWEATLQRVGAARDVEVESRVPAIARQDEIAGTQTPVFWHAPAIGTISYFTGPTVPASFVDRVSADGVVRVHLGLPAYSPRWTVAADDYLEGAARLLFDGVRRIGTLTPPLVVWELHNGLVRLVSGPNGSITVSCWDSAAWRSAKSYAFTVAGAALTTAPELTVLRNDPEEVTVRLTYPASPGRVTVDLGLRRGARFVTGVIKRHSAAALGVVRTAAETAAAASGGLRATAADADGNRFVMGSSRLLATATATASISKAAVTRFDFFLGHEVDASPAAGDAFADLLAQYLGSAGERMRIVHR